MFRYNRRFYRHVSFENMLGLAANHAPASYREIIRRRSPSKDQIAGDARPLHVGEPDERDKPPFLFVSFFASSGYSENDYTMVIKMPAFT